MGKGSSSAPTPDPNIGIAARMQAETGEAWLGFAKDAFQISTARQDELDALTRQVSEMQLGVMADQAGWMREDRKRYERDFKPLEDDFLETARSYDSPERQAAAAAEAKADVQSAAAGAKAAAQRDAAGLGISPTSGRYAGLDRAAEMGTALAEAGAMNTARQQVRDRGIALKADAVNLGRGLPAQSAQAAGLGVGAGSSAVGLHQGNQQIFNSSAGIMSQGYQGQMAGYAGQANALNQQYSTQVAAWDAENRNKAAGAAGFGQFLGGIAGLMFKSDEDAKEDKAPLPEGAGLDAVNAMPVEEWTYKEGVADEGRHVGPYAQGFTAATGLGNGREIAVQDAIGVSLKAIQDLDDKVDRIVDAVGLGGRTAQSRKRARNDNQPAGLAA